jgi:pimeloyl-ACP methyl ester carboxylesterase
LRLKINDISLHYHMTGEGYPVILLHGWGGSISSFEPVHKHLETKFKTCSIDLPGFGRSDPPKTAWTTLDYADFLIHFFNEMGIYNPIILGHSFGGRIGIRLASSFPVKKLVLIDSAGIKSRRSIVYYGKVYSFKIASRILKLPIINHFTANILGVLRNKFGSKDYQNASPRLREILVKTVNEDLRNLLPHIKCPTLLVWGDKDTATPIADALLMKELIPDAGLVRFPTAGHFSYLERLDEFSIVIDNFLMNEALIQNV